MAAAVFGLFISASLRCDHDVDGEVFARTGKLAFQSARVADAALRIIHEAQQVGAATTSTIALDVGPYLVAELLSGEAGPRFFHDNCEAVVVEEKRRARRPAGIAWRPFVGADVVEL